MRQFAEERVNRVESDADEPLRHLPDSWPFSRGSRFWVAVTFFVAVHILRHPFGQQHVQRI